MTYVGWVLIVTTPLVFLTALLWRGAPGWLRVTVCALLIVAAVVFLGADIAAGAKSTKPHWTTWLTYPTLSLLQEDPELMPILAYKNAISTILGTILATVTIWFAVVLPYQSVAALKDELKRSEIVEIKPIHKKGVDDIKTLTELLTPAREALMFAGSYDWLIKPANESEESQNATRELNTILRRMINDNHIVFVSDKKTRSTVLSRLETINPEFACLFKKCFNEERGPDDKIMLTLLKYDGPQRKICSRVGEIRQRSPTKSNNIIVYSGTPGGDVLIDIIERLSESEAPLKKTGKRT